MFFVVSKLALRVLPAVTRLTVYCWLFIELNLLPNRSSAQRVMTRRASTGHATAGEFTGAEGKAADTTPYIYGING